MRADVVAPLILGSVLIAAAVIAMLIAGLVGLPPKRPALGAAAAAALVLATRRPTAVWELPVVRSWEILLGSRRVRIGLLTLGLIALLLAVYAPLSWLRFLPS